MRPSLILATSLLAVAGLSACGGAADTATVPLGATPTPEASTAASDPPAATSSAADPGAVATAYPEIGLTFADLPQGTGAEQAAVQSWAQYEIAARRTVTTLKLDPGIAKYRDSEAVADARAAIKYLTQHHERQSGELQARFVKLLAAQSRIVVFDACLDGTHAWLASTDGGDNQPLQPATDKLRVEMTQVAGLWKVTGHETTGPC